MEFAQCTNWPFQYRDTTAKMGYGVLHWSTTIDNDQCHDDHYQCFLILRFHRIVRVIHVDTNSVAIVTHEFVIYSDNSVGRIGHIGKHPKY